MDAGTAREVDIESRGRKAQRRSVARGFEAHSRIYSGRVLEMCDITLLSDGVCFTEILNCNRRMRDALEKGKWNAQTQRSKIGLSSFCNIEEPSYLSSESPSTYSTRNQSLEQTRSHLSLPSRSPYQIITQQQLSPRDSLE